MSAGRVVKGRLVLGPDGVWRERPTRAQAREARLRRAVDDARLFLALAPAFRREAPELLPALAAFCVGKFPLGGA